MKNSNNKGYMLVEIILAFAITFALLYFMMDLVFKIKNKNDDLLVETIVKTDSTIIANKLMELAKNEKNQFNCNNLKIEDKSIIYIDTLGNKNILNVLNEYTTTSTIKCKNENNIISIKIPLGVKQLRDDNFDVDINYIYGPSDIIPSFGKESGITFKIFNYSGDNSQTGINDNGVYEYFTFRNDSTELPMKIPDIDKDGFGVGTLKVLKKLGNDGYPIFNCQGTPGCNNFSLGYLFGSDKNPLGNEPNGVIAYNPNNTLLQKDYTTGYYYYDNYKNAVDYDTTNNKFIVKKYKERGIYTTILDDPNIYDFLPFNYWDDTKKFGKYENEEYNYALDETDYWFGMTMVFDFYVPENGIINDKEMIFSFTGDDDVWVFIDDILMLDLGGTHGAVDGIINFATKKISSQLNWNGTLGEKYETSISKRIEEATGTADNLNENEMHTLKFFYLERGAGSSNCKIKFNIEAIKPK